jgi:hypothetical protein
MSQDSVEEMAAGLQLRGVSAPVIEVMKAGTFMVVEVSGKAFDVVRLTAPDQVITKSGLTEWAWSITPKEAGDQLLYFAIGVRIKLPGMPEERKFYPVKAKVLTIGSDAAYATKAFIGRNWQCLMSAIVLPLLLWIAKRYAAGKSTKALTKPVIWIRDR